MKSLNPSRQLTTELGIICAILVLVLGSGCMDSRGNSSGSINITDMAGRQVEVPSRVDRVVGIEAGALRLLVYLDVVDRVVGVEDYERTDNLRPYILAHPELSNRTVIGPIHGGDAELITSANPQVIFWTYTEAGDAQDLQDKTGIPVVVIEYGDLDDQREIFFDALRLMGRILGEEDRAEDLVSYFESTIRDLGRRTVDAGESGSCYVGGVSYRGSHGILSTEPRYAPFLFLGVENVASDLGVEHAFVDAEALIEWNPDTIFVDEAGYSLVMQDFRNNTAFGTMKAVREGSVYGVLPYNYYTANYGTILANAYYVGKVLYPEAFSDIDPEEKADEIYLELLGKGVYGRMEALFGGLKELNVDYG